jgi:hypothetical protein
VLFLIACLLAQSAANANQDSDAPTYKIYTEHPRLFLRTSRMRLLKRERERKSLRWEQFDTLFRANAPFPQPGFANALYFSVAGDRSAGRQAVTWALANKDISPNGLYQVALVYDWCQEIVSETEKKKLEITLEKAMSSPGVSLDAVRIRLAAAVALGSEAGVQKFFERDWKPRIEALRAGKNVISREEVFPLYEILHLVQDNLQLDLREQYPKYFKDLPMVHLMSYYPAPFPAAESEYRIPATRNLKEPDLEQAALSRTAELEIVAFDSNSPESQVLQGWLMNDRFLMRGMFGITYEFLWANPYQPGLSYYHVPLVYHDELFGRLFVRSSWEDDATWAGFFDGQLQLFRDGAVTFLNPEISREPLDLEEATLFFGRDVHKVQLPAKEVNDAFIVGVDPNRNYRVEIDDEELWEVKSDPGGILYFPGLRGNVGLRFQAAR